VKHRERPPVREQGLSPRYRPGSDDSPRPMSARTAAMLWTVQVLLVGTYATLLTVHVVSPSFPFVFNTVVLFVIVAVNFGLKDRARVSPVPTTAQKVLSVVSLSVVVIWVLGVVFFTGFLQPAGAVVAIAIWVVSFGLLLGAVVAVYRARAFQWKGPADGG
jgi:hypothetical protein